MTIDSIIAGDATKGLRSVERDSVDCCVTSPPYYGLRDYGVDEQIGQENTPDDYINNLVEVFREVKRVLKSTGTLWVNIGDSYCGTGSKGAYTDPKYQDGRNGQVVSKTQSIQGIKHKDLIGIPWLLAFALRNDGWYLRQDIIWAKPNPMPESVRDRCTKSYEHIFLLSKSPKYYFDAAAIAEPVASSTIKRLGQDLDNQKGSDRVPGKTNGRMKAVAPRYGGNKYTATHEIFNRTKSGNAYDYRPFRNKRDVWFVSTKPFKGAHFATFPIDLIEPCVLAGSPENGLILDPFMGSGTVAVAALLHGRHYLGCELNEEYIKLAEERISNTIITEKPVVRQETWKNQIAWLDTILPTSGGDA